MSGETVIGETAMRAEKTGGDIEVRLRGLSQLFTDPDPSPFREGNLTTEAEEYFLLKAKELPKNQPVRIVIHLPADEAARRSPPDIAAAMTQPLRLQRERRIQEDQGAVQNRTRRGVDRLRNARHLPLPRLACDGKPSRPPDHADCPGKLRHSGVGLDLETA